MTPAPLLAPDGARTGLRYAAFPVPGKPPRYRDGTAPDPGDTVGYRFEDERTGRRLVFLPGAAALTAAVLAELRACDCRPAAGRHLWSNDELPAEAKPAA